ncbi:protein involved in polysaccharide export, contains SLBB domain of the beta-grasp fold [Acinetobacter marinus]|uniref:Protein involved in polysaccharide export, contains SLBB domain of the beta-grasp fold n=1 Tax=Acinetobacter marinus TaxID=281375 RepID=A0A1G6L039_9GAMM|nr:polysaccharide biosynthesis/export family protein [Acinetobacter marinus]SDC36563.1 protein involved in polysaccharide export, contains SLBB domain of the beta-grasp fold [Acinetobacter marinus]
MKKTLLATFLASQISFAFAATDDTMLPDSDVLSSGPSGSASQTIDASANQEQAQAAAMLPSNSVINLGNTGAKYSQVNSRMFGAQLFKGAFATSAGSTFNSSYVINPGDNINLRLWGAYQFAGSLTVDPEGNIFVPNVGPVKVAGTTNGNLQNLIERNVRRVYVANVGVYAALEQAQPVKVLVTGFVNQPGNYGGVANDTVLAYLDRAGGVDPERGSYVDIQIQRNGRMIQYVNLYDFLLAGQIQPFSFKDGDVIVVAPRKHTFSVSGEVFNPFDFEFNVDQLTVEQALSVAKPKPGATHVSISRRQGSEYRSEYYSIAEAQNVVLQDGDVLSVTADRYAGTIQVRIEGAHNGTRAIVLPYGAKLSEVLKQLKPNELSEVQNLQLFRPSVAKRQKEMLNVALDKLEESTYSVRSATKEEASLRLQDAQLVKQFVEKARKVVPKGQVVLNPNSFSNVILEQGDVLNIPEKTSVIMVHGEVMFPNAVEWQKGMTAKDYINQVGGYTQKSNKSKVIIVHQNGESELVKSRYQLKEGDEIMVLPKVSSKGIEIARGLTTILYQIAIAAKVALDI